MIKRRTLQGVSVHCKVYSPREARDCRVNVIILDVAEDLDLGAE